MEDAFGIVLFVVVVAAAIVAVVTVAGSGELYSRIGRGGLSLNEDRDLRRGPAAGSPAALAERDEEVRQMLGARNARRIARGEAPLDVEAELARLAAPAPVADPALREEVRQLVEARNERRRRRGEPPLDVEAEVQRQLRDLLG
jgi:hypothetical protein